MAQWQAQEGAQALAALAAGASVATAAPPLSAAGASAGVAAGLLPPLKSVAYQPEPLSWNPAAVSCLLKVGLPHEGQVFKGGSEIF